MRILLLAPYPAYPPRGGGALRIYHLARGLAARHELSILSFAPDTAAVAAMAPLRAYGRLISVIGPPPRTMARRIRDTALARLPDMALRNRSHAYTEALTRLLASESFDLIQAESIEMADYALLARGLGAQLVLDQFNAEYLLQQRAALSDLRRGAFAGALYSLIQWRKLARYERRLLQSFDLLSVVSADDRAALARLLPAAPARLAVVPNGVDTTQVRPAAVRGDLGPATLCFVATLDYRPNIDAARWFVQQVLPLIAARRPDVHLLLVGRAAGPAIHALAGPQVEVVGEVADVRPYINGAAVCVVPMRIGGGSRLKLLEALALEAPVVCTPLGAEGIEGLRHGEHLLLAESPAAFAEATLGLLAEPRLGQLLGAAGRAHVCAHYDWQAIIPRLEAAYAQT